VSGTMDDLVYALDSCLRKQDPQGNDAVSSVLPSAGGIVPGHSIPRIARLMALAIRFDGLLREGTIQDYAELARLGRVTRARMTQIMKLLDLAPDIQERILFLPGSTKLKERNLRGMVACTDWNRQRPLFRKMMNREAVREEPPG
jgi:hypothetical protein